MPSMSNQPPNKQSAAPKRTKSLVVVKDLSILSLAGEPLVKDATFSLTNQSRAALVGANGSGKSTLLKALSRSKEVSIESGSIDYPHKGSLIETVPQHPPESVLDLTPVEMLVEHLEKRQGSHAEDWKAYPVLDQMGFTDKKLETKIRNLSGGEINLALLARALVTEPALVLLDEPTNHLDTEGIYRFESALSTVRVPFLVVSHDRALLDRFTNQTLFIAYGELNSYDLPYSKAKQQLQAEREGLVDLRKRQERTHAKMKKHAHWLQNWAKMSDDMAQVYRAHLTKLAKFEEQMVEVPKERENSINLRAKEIRASTCLQVRDASVHIPGTDRLLFDAPSLALRPGERIAIMGPNGAGKSTFLEQIVRTYTEDDGDSSIRLNPQIKLGYFDQKQTSLNPDSTLFDFIQSQTELGTQQTHAVLAKAGFPYQRHHDTISHLSGGEKARLQFLAINEAGVNLLILDEPTNHLDVQGIEFLEDQLEEYSGSVLLVTHDRQFLENVATTFYLIRDRELRIVSGPETYYEYLDQLEEGEPTEKSKPQGTEALTVPSEDELFRKWTELEQQREGMAKDSGPYKRITNQIAELETEIDRLSKGN